MGRGAIIVRVQLLHSVQEHNQGKARRWRAMAALCSQFQSVGASRDEVKRSREAVKEERRKVGVVRWMLLIIICYSTWVCCDTNTPGRERQLRAHDDPPGVLCGSFGSRDRLCPCTSCTVQFVKGQSRQTRVECQGQAAPSSHLRFPPKAHQTLLLYHLHNPSLALHASTNSLSLSQPSAPPRHNNPESNFQSKPTQHGA